MSQVSFLKANNELDAERVIRAAEQLARRVADRFPKSELRQLADKIVTLAQISQKRADDIVKPMYGIRFLRVLVISWLGVMMLLSLLMLLFSLFEQNVTDIIQAVEASLNTVVLIGLGIFFIYSLETRLKRAKALKALNELRILAHVVDMRQLSKDPEKLSRHYVRTANSPLMQEMNAAQLSRYFNYCIELLAILGKIAALYGQRTEDHETINAVNDIEMLTNELARKIWQKLTLLYPLIAIDK